MASRRSRIEVDPRYVEALRRRSSPVRGQRVIRLEEVDDDDDDDEFDDDAQFDQDQPPAAPPKPAPAPGAPQVPTDDGGSTPAAVLALKPPWHMWGTTETVVRPSVGSGVVPEVPTTQQLVKVSYKRPETWHWLFQVKLLDGPNAPNPGDHAIVQVYFDVIVGIGRSSIIMPGFEMFQIEWNSPADAPIGTTLWSNQAIGPNRIFVTPGGPSPAQTKDNIISEIVAQDIQVSARVFFGTPGGLTGTATVECSAHFAPKTHVRPDWFRNRPEDTSFPGGEVEGQ